MDLGVLKQRSNDFDPSFRGNARIGLSYSVIKKVEAGILIGYDQYEDVSAFPILVSGRWFWLSSRFSPFFNAQVGRSIAWQNEQDFRFFENVSGGLNWGVGGGLRYKWQQVAVVGQLGFQSQTLKILVSDFEDFRRVEDRTNRRLNASIGIQVSF